jgi:uncharacterized membrane protein
MVSKYLLKIKDPNIMKSYSEDRIKDIAFINFIAFLVRLVSLIGSVIGKIAISSAFSPSYWSARGATLAWQAAFIFLGFIRPHKVNKYQALLFVPTYCFQLISLHSDAHS